jgi:hypothetical protein
MQLTALVKTTPPSTDPVTAADVKAQLRLEDTTFDTLLAALIPVCTDAVAEYLRRSL